MLKGMKTKRNKINKIIPIVYWYREPDEYDLLGEDNLQDMDLYGEYSENGIYEYKVEQYTHLVFPHMDSQDLGNISENAGHIVTLECERSKHNNCSRVKKAYCDRENIFKSFPRLKRAYFKIKKWRF